ncbi:biphenyl-2,3-diol 1,2-dioxygenase [Pokkaliibacter plantistimulans]|uniref:biphenyl-2,3-diol 1,2-dioxygenase n=1 Tax=Pokkaliibacter plantistimulans TaxID=1635171 RepID=UPI000D7425D1|nr:biphenyl-2,3-diol 1,2-dioxygenase [Pokkaliibacter plantistimulans]
MSSLNNNSNTDDKPFPSVLPEWPEPQRPDFVQPVRRPPALVKADALAFLIFERPDLDKSERFLLDFGLQVIRRDADALYLRASASEACCYVVRRGQQARFIGVGFELRESSGLDVLVKQAGARRISKLDIPGGGQAVLLTDPLGHEVWVLAGRQHSSCMIEQEPRLPTNTPTATPRVNATVRPSFGPAKVARLGHVVFQTTDFAGLTEWYMRHFGLLPTDVLYLPDGSPNLIFFRFDRGSEPADHHSVVIAGGLTNSYEHSAYEVQDLDALGQSSQFLRSRNWKHAWGIGRHSLGSQLFDYWFDPYGAEHEHYADGDVFTADYAPRYSPMNAAGVWMWGDDVPPHMLPKPNLITVWRAIRLLCSGKLSLARLKQMGAALSAPARPWMK